MPGQCRGFKGNGWGLWLMKTAQTGIYQTAENVFGNLPRSDVGSGKFLFK
jgi:hypothetical protein